MAHGWRMKPARHNNFTDIQKGDKHLVKTDLWFVSHQTSMLQNIGSVTIHWAAIDLCMANISAVALRNRAAAMKVIFGSHNAGAQRFEAFKDIIGESYFDAEERTAIIAVVNELRKCLSARNDIIHSPMVIDFSLSDSQVAANIKKISRDGVRKDLTNVQEHLDDVKRLLSELDEIFDYLVEKYDEDQER